MPESTDCVTATEPREAGGAAPGPDPDLSLVRRAQAGDTDVLGELVERNRKAVFVPPSRRWGRRPTRTTSRRRPSCSLYRKPLLRGEAAFRTWLLAITWRKALDRRKSVGRWLRLTVSQADPDSTATNWSNICPLTNDRRKRTSRPGSCSKPFGGSSGQLPRSQRDALLLAGSGEHSYSQIGFILGVPVGTVKWRVSEARRVLEREDGRCGTPV